MGLYGERRQQQTKISSVDATKNYKLVLQHTSRHRHLHRSIPIIFSTPPSESPRSPTMRRHPARQSSVSTN
ncbi:hypothetical protein BRADI_1g65825v3 [Brachypodium distachyon]|uniref:Uncharacterized protein n=1 Tax=Brachypodium distachyon TaxID=15368 RepID=A0A2K2DTK5_BRADI|nr:hypothetical protein BRADI_1g65825v3 [Brachypodium distachyon]